jgi:hypothetical protein
MNCVELSRAYFSSQERRKPSMMCAQPLYQLSPEGKGKKLVVGTLGPGAFFGEMLLLGQRGPRSG